MYSNIVDVLTSTILYFQHIFSETRGLGADPSNKSATSGEYIRTISASAYTDLMTPLDCSMIHVIDTAPSPLPY